MLGLQLHDQALGALPLQAEVAAGRTAAADDRQLGLLRVLPRLFLRPTYTSGRMTTCAPSSDTSLAGIAFSEPAKNRFRSSVSMKSSAWWPSAIFVAPTSFAMRYSTPRRSRAQSEHGVAPASRMSSMTSPMPGVLDAVFPSARLARAGDDVVLVVLVAGVDVDGDEREANRRALPQHVEDLQQRPAVLAAGQPDHDAVAVLEHLVVDDRLGRLLREPRLELTAISHVVASDLNGP